MKLEGRVAFVTGASRGIGKVIALTLARAGCHVVCAARSVRSTAALPGSIHKTAEEVRALGRRALAARVDVREPDTVHAAVAEAVQTFGQIDLLINNAGQLRWEPIQGTDSSVFDELLATNARGAFTCAQAVLPHMIAARYGHILTIAPPIVARGAGGKIAYVASKLAATVIALGVAEEVYAHNVASNTLWPATLIESRITQDNRLATARSWRKPEIMADAALRVLATPPRERTGQTLIDEDVLREAGVTDLSSYRCVADCEPPSVGFDYIRHR